MSLVPIQRLREYASYLLVRVFVCVAQTLRMETCWALSRLAAKICTDFVPLRRAVIEENLRLAYPHLDAAARRRMTRRMWEHLFLMAAEVVHAPRKVHDTNWRDFFVLKRSNEVVEMFLDDRPTIFVAAHFGNFELGGDILALLGFPPHSIARTLDNPYLNAYITRFRRRKGQALIPKKGGYDDIVRLLSEGEIMGFLADQYAGAKGCWVNFFGRPASAHKAIALLALEHDARVAVGYCRRLDRPMRFEVNLIDILDVRQAQEARGVRELTQWYTSRLEQAIRLSPDQYWWVHRRWKDNRPAKKSRRLAS